MIENFRAMVLHGDHMRKIQKKYLGRMKNGSS